jgi:hypothetical protein
VRFVVLLIAAGINAPDMAMLPSCSVRGVI